MEQIIDAAFSVVREHGWEELSARSIAGKLNSSTRPIYSYLNSMKQLEEEVVKKALDLFREYVTQPSTGDPWLDNSIGYLSFAIREPHLFQCIHDRKHIGMHREYRLDIWNELNGRLADYGRFQGKSEEWKERIRWMKYMLIHGVATMINSGHYPPADDGSFMIFSKKISVVDVVDTVCRVLYQGMKDEEI